jgi:hypothetical protein
MPFTLYDAQKMTNNVIEQGIIENIILESRVLEMLPFEELNGVALVYNQEATLSGANFYAVGDTWNEQAVTVTQKQTNLTILGGDIDVDSFLQQTYRRPNDLRAEAIAKKAKAVAYSFNSAFFNGNAFVDPKSFNGLSQLVTSGQTISLGPNGAAPTLENFDALIDLVKPGKPDALLMSKRTRRGLKKLRRQTNAVLEVDMDMFGRQVEFYDGIPIIVDDNILDNNTIGTATTCSTVYAVQFGYQRGVMGLTNGGIQYNEIGELETKDAMRMRIKWYCGLLNYRDLALAEMVGVLAN